MTSRIVRHATKAALFAAVLLAACLFGSRANAQSDFQGRFTLLYETRWGRAVLPPGEYQLTFDHSSPGPMLVVRDVKSRLIVAYELTDVRDDGTKGPSALLIGTQGTRRAVQSLRIAELGKTFVYERPPAQGRSTEEAGQTQAVPVVIAKK
jgi:hypothetical protein